MACFSFWYLHKRCRCCPSEWDFHGIYLCAFIILKPADLLQPLLLPFAVQTQVDISLEVEERQSNRLMELASLTFSRRSKTVAHRPILRYRLRNYLSPNFRYANERYNVSSGAHFLFWSHMSSCAPLMGTSAYNPSQTDEQQQLLL